MMAGNRELSLVAAPSAILPFAGRQPSADNERGVDDPTADLRAGWLIAFLFFVLFVGWAAVARLDAAAMVPGKLVVSGQRQTVQHREGGIVGQIYVAEGQKVAKDQVLFRLSASDVEAQERALSGQAITLLAQRARLQAEQMGRTSIVMPAEFATFTSPEERTEIARAMQMQRAQLQTRLAVVRAQRGALAQRTSGAGNLVRGYRDQVASLDQQIASITQELESLREVADRGFVSTSRIRQLERARAELIGQRSQFSATAAQTRDQADESRLQSLEAQSAYLERSASELRDVEAALNDTLPRLNAVRDQLARTIIRSPAGGTVVGLQVFTPGGVVSPGQRLLDVVPDSAALLVEARVSLDYGDDIRTGQDAFVRFDSLQEKSLTPLQGKIVRVSADSFTDERSGESYFTAAIAVPPDQIERLKEVRGADFELRAGMPVFIEVPVRRRTALQYMLEPLTSAMRRSGREY